MLHVHTHTHTYTHTHTHTHTRTHTQEPATTDPYHTIPNRRMTNQSKISDCTK